MAQNIGFKSNKVRSPAGRSSPFQATKLWNQMIRNFRDGIELKKRRWKMKSYENTFCGQDAVNWFHLYLRTNQKFGDHVTRAQAKLLLQKFFENGIFEDARGKQKTNFEDDSHLYRFTSKADLICKNKTEIATQRSVTNLLRSVSIRRKPLSSIEPGNVENNKVNQLRKGAITRSQSLKCAYMSPRNTTVPPESIRVTPVSQDLESFQISSAEKQYKENAVDVAPISTVSHPETFGTKIEQPDFDLSDEQNYNSILQDAGIDNHAFIVTDLSPWETAFQRTWSLRDPKAMKYRHKFFVQCDEEETVHEPNFIMNKSIRKKKLKRTKSSKFVTGISYVENGQAESPTKKARVEEKLQEIPEGVDVPGEEKVETVPGSYLFDRKKSLRSSMKSDSSLRQMKRKASLRTKSFYNAIDDNGSIWKEKTLLGLRNLLKNDYLDNFVNLSVISGHETEINISMELRTAEIPEWTLSAMKYLVDWPDSKTKEKDNDFPAYDGFECDVFRAIQDHYESTLKEPLMTYNMFKLLDISSDIIAKDKATAIEIFQRICLLIPTWNRKQIYLILRFMDKVAQNPLLKLSKDLPNREMVIRSFYQTITRNKEMNHIEKDQMTSIRIVEFMIDNHEQILAVPDELKTLKEKLREERAIINNPVTTERVTTPCPSRDQTQRPVSLCVQYTKDEFSKQAIDCTRQALIDLLNMIANDDTLHPKIKKKRLKEFKKNYPEIYQSKFPEDNISTCSTSSQRTLRIRNTIRPFFGLNKRNADL